MLNNWKKKPYRSDEYLQFVREQPCCICGTSPCDPSHLNHKGNHSGGMATKVSDYRTVPKCRIHHTEYHDIGRDSMEQKYRVDFREILINTMELYIATNGKGNP